VSRGLGDVYKRQTQLFVAESDRYEGVIHLHDLIREGLI
jgi:hypothetical protein